MESKKLPVLWALVRNWGNEKGRVECDENDDAKVLFEPAAFCGASCEPYIPVARVRELVEKLTRAMNAAVDTQRIDLAHRYSQRIDDLEELIADVEDV